MKEPKLPKKVEQDPRFSAISELLLRTRTPLWERSEFYVSKLPWTDAMERSLANAVLARKVELGLETIERVLEVQKRGLNAMQKPQGTVAANRVSRMLLVSNDGSERLYRACESLLRKHGERLRVLWIDVPAAQLGEKVFGPARGIKVLMIADRVQVENLFFSLVE